MRRIRTLLSLVAAGVFVSTASVHAQLVERVGMLTAQWKYSIDNSDQYALGFPNLDDTAWPSSTALFGNDGGYPYPFVVQFNGPGGNPAGPLTAYYRTRFNWVGSTVGVVLTMTNYIDDGYVIYLNGTEIQRYDVNDPPFTHATQSPTANPAGEGVAVVRQVALDTLTNGNPNPLIAGENIVSVSVHQAGAGSSDHAFGMSVYSSQIIPPLPDSSTPADVVALQCRNATFTVVQVPGSGVPSPTIQWFRNVGSGDEAITGEVGSSLTVSNVQAGNAGQYWAVLSNPGNVVPSRRAQLTVTPDTQGPLVSSVVFVGGANNEFVVTYNEPVDVIATINALDTFNYVFTGTDGHSINAAAVTADPNNPAVFHATAAEALHAGVAYTYHIGGDSEIEDACNRNATPIGTLNGPVNQKANILHWTDGRLWRYNESGADQATAWRAVGFDASSWAEGPQGFGNEGGGFPDAPDSQRTPLTRSVTQITYYFRTTFTVPAGATDVRVSARVDDGAAIYVNGTEVGRVNIAANLPLAFDTLTPNLFDPENTGYSPADGILIPSSLLVSGNNVLAIEVHQNSTTSSDVIMLARIEANVGFIPPTPPEITQDPVSTSVTEGHSFRFNALASGSTLTYQWYKVGTPDVAIAGATSSSYQAVATSTSGGGYYVIASNPDGSDRSATATLTVRPVVAPYGHTWKYSIDSQDATLTGGTPWYAVGFDDTAWPSGAGPLGAETSGTGLARLPAPIATILPAPSATFLTAYFRTKVTVPALTAGQTLVLTHYIDDGAAIYIDGVLASRYNLTNPPPILSTALTPAATPGDSEANLISIPLALSAGEHTIAVEVHQNSATSSDVVFGAELRVISSTAPALTITKAPPLGVQLSWTADPFYSLFSATTVGGPYSHVLSNPQGTFSVVNATNPASFYRIGFNGQ